MTEMKDQIPRSSHHGKEFLSKHSLVSDLDFFHGDFLATDSSLGIIDRIAADSGFRTVYLDTDVLNSMGLGVMDELITGVVVVGESPPVPSVSAWGLISMALLLLTTPTAILLWRRRSAA